MEAVELSPGQEFIVEKYPFVRSSYVEQDEDGAVVFPSWKPGIDHEIIGPEGEAQAVYDDLGKQILCVVSTHKPGKYPERVFYTRKWIDPDGNQFGKNSLRISVKHKFIRLTKGYGYGSREIEAPVPRFPPTPLEKECG